MVLCLSKKKKGFIPFNLKRQKESCLSRLFNYSLHLGDTMTLTHNFAWSSAFPPSLALSPLCLCMTVFLIPSVIPASLSLCHILHPSSSPCHFFCISAAHTLHSLLPISNSIFYCLSLSHTDFLFNHFLYFLLFLSLFFLPGIRLCFSFLLWVSFINLPVSLIFLIWVCFRLVLFSPLLVFLCFLSCLWHVPLQAVTVSHWFISTFFLSAFSFPLTPTVPPLSLSLSFCSSALSSRHSAV